MPLVINDQCMLQCAQVCRSFGKTIPVSWNIQVGFQSQGMSWLMQKSLHWEDLKSWVSVVRNGPTALQAKAGVTTSYSNGLWVTMSVCYTYTELTPKQSLQRILQVLSRFSSIPHQPHSLPKEWVKNCVLLHSPPCPPSEQNLPSLLLWLLLMPDCCSPISGAAQKDCRALTLFAGVSQNFVDLCICRVLPQCPDDIANLAEGDLGITSPVKEEEGLLEVCKRRATLSQAAPYWQRCEPAVSWHCSTDSRGVSQGNLWPIVPRKTPPLWHFGFTIFKLLYLPFMSFLALIAINSFLIDPVVISRTRKDKFSTNSVIQEPVPSHDVAADGKNVVIHSTLSLQRTGTVKSLAVQNLCLLQWVLPAIPAPQLTVLIGNLKVDFKCLYCCFLLKLPYNVISKHVCSLFFSILCSLSLLLTDA